MIYQFVNNLVQVLSGSVKYFILAVEYYVDVYNKSFIM